MIGPTIAFSSVGSGAGAWRMNRCSKNPLPNWAMNPASRKPVAISFHSICQSPRKFSATSDHARIEVSRSRHDSCARVVWC